MIFKTKIIEICENGYYFMFESSPTDLTIKWSSTGGVKDSEKINFSLTKEELLELSKFIKEVANEK